MEKKLEESEFGRAEKERKKRDVSTSQRAEGEDEGEGGTINFLTSLNVHLMMHT